MDPSALLDDDRLTTMGLLIETAEGLADVTASQLAEHDLTNPSFSVLLRLGRSPGQRLRMSDLAAQVGLSTSGLTRLVDRLEIVDLVAREACPTDRRGAFAVLTEPGRNRLQAALPAHLALVERWFTGVLAPDEVAGLVVALRKVRDVVRPCAAAGAQATVSSTGMPLSTALPDSGS